MVQMAVQQNNKTKSYRITVEGIVQGVGFRPFVYHTARRNHLNGYVQNTSGGVEIYIAGNRNNIDSFLYELEHSVPPLARITRITKKPIPGEQPRVLGDFRILESDSGAEATTLIPPDVAVCDDCLRELFNPTDRRYRYPFINCTNCGPRYTIIKSIPYDRQYTTMKQFTMCYECQREYDDPDNRRFHAQPNACPNCGPQITLVYRNGIPIQGDAIQNTIQLLKQGYIIAIKGIGGFHLACDARNDSAVSTLRERKHREEKPLAVMIDNCDTAEKFVHITDAERRLLNSFQRPIVLLQKKLPEVLSQNISPRNNSIGVLLPYTPLHYLLFHNSFTALVMTSGNLSEEPIATENDEALQRLSGIADYFLLHNRDIYIRNDDSVYRVIGIDHYPVRRSRGYAPAPVFLNHRMPSVFACGAELKNTLCLTKGDKAFVSQHIGDLENYETLQSFELTYKHLCSVLEIEPTITAYDLHPEYLSTKYALEQLSEMPLVGVQHHHAHIASCMAEHQVDGKVIGIALDGTGYGTDGTLWGGEVLIANFYQFERSAHLAYVPLPGGEKAIKEPWRMALSYLVSVYGNDAQEIAAKLLSDISEYESTAVFRMIAKRINSPVTSSCGRLFDAVSALTGVRHFVRYEGQAAIELENCIPPGISYSGDKTERYDFSIDTGSLITVISPAETISGVIEDMGNKVSIEKISFKFHNTIIEMYSAVAERLRAERGLHTVVLSGGCFQNVYLLTNMTAILEKRGFTVYSHRLVPPNDGGISLGQAVIAGLTALRKG
jgi:hydrogenase maturation protein HypF